jgi:hypothetical protein
MALILLFGPEQKRCIVAELDPGRTISKTKIETIDISQK